MAVALFQVLREELLAAIARKELRKGVVVGVITPYREQVTCIRDTLEYVLGPQLAREVRVRCLFGSRNICISCNLCRIICGNIFRIYIGRIGEVSM